AFATWTVTQKVIAPELGWRRGFLFPALLLFVVMIIFFLLTRDAPESERPGPSRQLESPVSKSSQAARSWKGGDLMKLLRSRALWSIGTSYFFLELCRYAL